MTLCCLGLGSNLKKPERLIRQAIAFLRKAQRVDILEISPLEITAPWGRVSQPFFCNTLLMINTTFSPLQLLAYCQQVEKRFGRVRKKHWGPRTLDIDILLYAGTTISTPELTIPHPWLFHREFILKPLRKMKIFKHRGFVSLNT